MVVIDQLYPPVCLACDAAVTVPDGLCPQCFSRLRPITAPLCPRLGIPFSVFLGDDALSPEAIANPPPFDRARAAFAYSEVTGRIVSRLKYGDRPELAGFCARAMASAGHEFWAGGPVLVPVPLHPLRQLHRRYNQSGELARALGRRLGLSVDSGLARRKKRTRQQVGLSGDARQRNVEGAFAAHPETLSRLKGRRVVIVDDVYTTGSTVSALTRVLRRAGAANIDVITFARVVIGDDRPI